MASGLARAMTDSKLQSSEDTYTPKCILMTGAAGFIGSHAAIRLVKNHPNVKVSRRILFFHFLALWSELVLCSLVDVEKGQIGRASRPAEAETAPPFFLFFVARDDEREMLRRD